MKCSYRRPWTIYGYYGYYKQALVASYIPDDPRSFKSVCLTCNAAHNLGQNILLFWDSIVVFTFFGDLCLGRAVIGTRRCGVSACTPVNICTLFFVVSLILLFGGSLRLEASAEIQAITKLEKEKEKNMVVLDSGISDSKVLDSRLHKQKFLQCWNPYSLAWGDDIWMQAKQLDSWIRRLR